MNSWKSTRVCACAPPFSTFNSGTGITCAPTPPRYRYSGSSVATAAARAHARLTASTALAPSLDLFEVPSSLQSSPSSATWSSASAPTSSGPITSTTLRTASRTPLPPYRAWSPSRSSTASCRPVLAPLGTREVAEVPPTSRTVASTVGLPRESSTSSAVTSSIYVMAAVRTPRPRPSPQQPGSGELLPEPPDGADPLPVLVERELLVGRVDAIVRQPEAHQHRGQPHQPRERLHRGDRAALAGEQRRAPEHLCHSPRGSRHGRMSRVGE